MDGRQLQSLAAAGCGQNRIPKGSSLSCRCAKTKDSLFPREKHGFPAVADGCEECMGIKSAPLGRYTWTHGITPCLGCRTEWRLAGEFFCAWRTVGLANRRHSGSGSICETVNHKGHEGTRRKRLRPQAFVILRVLGGSGFCGLRR